MDKTREFFVIRDETTGLFFHEEDGGGGPGPYTIRDWVKSIHDAERFDVEEEFEESGWYKTCKAQDFIHPDCFTMPLTARLLRVRITEKIVEVV